LQEKKMKNKSILVLAIVATVVSASPVSAEVLYNITDLGRGRAMSISDNGQIVGHCSGRAMLFDPTGGGNNIMLDNQEGVVSYALSINNEGQVVGNIEPAPGESSAVIFDPTGEGNHTYLSAPTGFSSCAYSINNNGQIVGYVKSGPSTPPEEFVYVATLFDSTSGDDITYLGPMLPRIGSAALSINDNGQIVGFCRGHATLFDPTGDGNNIDLGTLENRPPVAYSINNIGQIVGTAHGMLGGSSLAILFDPTGGGNNIAMGGGAAKSINNSGQIVGARIYRIAPMSHHAILFDPTGEGNNIDLNTLIDPNLGWELNSAESINNNGWIVGRGINPDGHAHAFLLKPILPAIEAEIDINPSMLNLQSKGKWITCHIRLGEDYNVVDIDPNTVLLEEQIAADLIKLEGQAAMAKFSSSSLQEMLADLDTLGEVELLVTGELIDGTKFEGTDTIKVIDKGNQK